MPDFSFKAADYRGCRIQREPIVPEAVIVAACRTAIGTSFKGSLTETPAIELASAVIEEAVQRSGLDPAEIDDVIFGEVMQGGGNIARHAAITAGLMSVPGLAAQRQCASSLSAIHAAAAGIMAGMDRAVIAGGAESVSTAPAMRIRIPGTQDWQDRWMPRSHPGTPEAPFDDMSITVGRNTAQLAPHRARPDRGDPEGTVPCGHLAVRCDAIRDQ
jgi:acetyl-CoA acetyltransferase